MPCRFLNDHFALKKCRILQTENLTSNMFFPDSMLLMHIMQVSLMLHVF